MASPIETLIETLMEARAKLDEQLGRNEAYRALRQLEQRETSGERLSIVSADQLRQALEAELASDSTFQTRRKIDESLALAAGWAKAGLVLPPVRSEADGAPQSQTPPEPVAAIAQAPEATRRIEPQMVLASVVEAPPAVAANPEPDIPALPPDDLSLVRDLPVACISVVTAAGYGRYEALAAIDSAGVGLLERLLGQRGIVSRGNWIEQAAILAQGRETSHAARLVALRMGAEWPPQPHAPEIIEAPPEAIVRSAPKPESPPAAVAVPEPAPAPVPPLDPRHAAPNDLTHIAGIDRIVADRLAARGTSFASMAAWTSSEVAGIATALGITPARIAQEGWIEQAALLSTGRVTRYLATKPVAAPLAALPPLLDIPLDEETEAAVETAPEAEVAAEPAPAPSAEPIVVPAAANDDPPPRTHDEPEPAPVVPPAIWPAAAAKAAILRPLRKPADRGDKAFDDVAALVAQTVATARNVGGRSERADRPAPSPPSARPAPPQAEPPRAPIAAKPAITSPAPAQAELPLPTVVARPVAAPAARAADTTAARVPPRTPVPPPIASPPARPARVVQPAPAPEPDRLPLRSRSPSADPEASIEIRPRATAASAIPVTAKQRSNGVVRSSAPSIAAAPARAPQADRPTKPLVATARSAAPADSPAPPRRVVVIDEIARPAPIAPPSEPERPIGQPIATRASGLFNRLVKALKGDTPD